MKIEFRRVLTESECLSTYLSLTDDSGRQYGAMLPEHNTKLAVIDGAGRVSFARRNYGSELWGDLHIWFRVNNIRPGTLVLVATILRNAEMVFL